jgi:hypothetical protein
MRLLPGVALLALLLFVFPSVAADEFDLLSSTRTMVYCDYGDPVPTCGMGTGARDDNCTTGTVGVCYYTDGGVGAGVRTEPTVPPCPPDQPYCSDVHAGANAACLGGVGLYYGEHNPVAEGGGWACVHACYTQELIQAVTSQPLSLARVTAYTELELNCEANP